jgi:hypothetical protein
MNKKLEDSMTKTAKLLMLANDQLAPYRTKSKLDNYLDNGKGTKDYKIASVREHITIARQALTEAEKLLR